MNKLHEKVLKILSSAVGDIVAKSTLDHQLKSLNLKAEELTDTNINPLAEKISSALVYFVGPDIAEKIGKEVRELLNKPINNV